MLQADKYSASPGEGHLAEPITDVQPARREPLFMGPTPAIHRSPEKGRSGGEPTFPICPAGDAQAEKQTFTHWR